MTAPSPTPLAILTLLAALGTGLNAGVFFAFSTFVMPALSRLPPAAGIGAMQAINAAAVNRWFMGLLFGTALVSLALSAATVATWALPGARLRWAGAVLYCVGTILVTMVCHVPRNLALDRVAPGGVGATLAWAEYLRGWVFWNHVRMVSSAVASALLTLASMRPTLAPWRGGVATLATTMGAFLFTGCNADTLRPIPPPGSTTPVLRLSELGLFEGKMAEQHPRPGVVAYEVNASHHTDGASQHRFVVVPPDTSIHASGDRWTVPTGVYFAKTFSYPRDLRDPSLGERLVETRFLVKTARGYIASTYVWSGDQTDAIVSAGNIDVPVSWIDHQGLEQHGRFHVAGTSQCDSCHAGRALGWRARQLDMDRSYADGTHDQIAHLVRHHVIDAAPPSEDERLVDPFGEASLDTRARSYLDANCSHCHGAGGIAESTDVLWDLNHTRREHLPLCRSTWTVDHNDRVLVPGHPEASAFLSRMRSTHSSVHMPRGPANLIDVAGIELLSAWVSSMPASPCR